LARDRAFKIKTTFALSIDKIRIIISRTTERTGLVSS